MKLDLDAIEARLEEARLIEWKRWPVLDKDVPALVARVRELETELKRARVITQGKMLEWEAGERGVDPLTGDAGTVQYVQEANLPWHNGGCPFVRWEDGTESYCYYLQKPADAPSEGKR